MSTKCQLKSVVSHRIAGIIGITIPNIPYKNYMDTKYGCGYRDGIVHLCYPVHLVQIMLIDCR